MSIITSFRDLEVWNQGMDLVEMCYTASRQFASEERYGLTSQLRRAAMSIPSNVAEGHCRRTTGAYANHISIACGSEGELETCIEVAHRLRYLTRAELTALIGPCSSVGKMLIRLHQSLEAKLELLSTPRGSRPGP